MRPACERITKSIHEPEITLFLSTILITFMAAWRTYADCSKAAAAAAGAREKVPKMEEM